MKVIPSPIVLACHLLGIESIDSLDRPVESRFDKSLKYSKIGVTTKSLQRTCIASAMFDVRYPDLTYWYLRYAACSVALSNLCFGVAVI